MVHEKKSENILKNLKKCIRFKKIARIRDINMLKNKILHLETMQ